MQSYYLNGTDTVIVAPTGFGKSLLHQAAPFLFDTSICYRWWLHVDLRKTTIHEKVVCLQQVHQTSHKETVTAGISAATLYAENQTA